MLQFNNRFEDDVNGSIVGQMISVGQLTYDGRNQYATIYADNEEQLKQKAAAILNSKKADLSEAFSLIYPNENKWALKILQS
jgi:hypothetical protein